MAKQKSALLKILSSALIFLIFASCQTLKKSTPWYLQSQTIKIDSYPEGARIVINGKYVGETPLKTTIVRGEYLKGCDICDWGNNLEIWAYPTQPGQCMQWRFIPFYERTPDKIHFDMTYCPKTLISEKLHIESIPEGASIEINQVYVGKTPLDISIIRHWTEPVVIIAYPPGEGQCPQRKIFPAYQNLPSNIFFDLRVCVPFAPMTVKTK